VKTPKANGTWGQGAEIIKINLRSVSLISININFRRRESRVKTKGTLLKEEF